MQPTKRSDLAHKGPIQHEGLVVGSFAVLLIHCSIPVCHIYSSLTAEESGICSKGECSQLASPGQGVQEKGVQGRRAGGVGGGGAETFGP